MKSEAESKAPKYLNSPDTPLFKKSYVLYNMHRARKYASDNQQLIIAEGYMDVIALSQAGFEGAVAPLGTAVTPEQLKLAWMVVNEPIMCLDGDKAGERAMLRSAETALPLLVAGKSLQFCILPEGEDPDSLILARGRGAMEQALAASIPLVEVLWRHHYLSKPLATPEQRAGAEKELMDTVAKITDEHVREHYKREMKERVKRAGVVRDDDAAHAPEKKASGARGGKKAAPAVPLPKLPDSKDIRVQLERCHEQILALVYHVPTLLAQGDVEAVVSNMQVKDEVLEATRQAALMLAVELHGGGAKALLDHVRVPVMRQKVQERMAIGRHLDLFSLTKLKEAEERERHGLARFATICERLAQVHFGVEHLNAALHMSSVGTDAALKRFVEMSKQAQQPYTDAGRYGSDD